MNFWRLTIIFAFLSAKSSFSQQAALHPSLQDSEAAKNGAFSQVELPAIIVNGDTLPVADLRGVSIVSNRVFRSYGDALKYYMLERDVEVAYPYALLAGATFRQCEETLKTMSDESEKKHYVKTVEKQLMKQYSDELKGLTVNQGKILIKLIDRETGNSSYEMVKELKGSFSAFMWQTVARLFGDNLKSTYDPDEEDRDIENIIGLIETGGI
jgi:hypothetical protein